MALVDKNILKEWREAQCNASVGYNALVVDFKARHPVEYRLFNAMYRKRVELKKDCEIMTDLSLPIYWITLTFKNSKDKNKIETKRKEAQRKLNEISVCYTMVEEYGEENGRYHIHALMSFKLGYGFNDFVEWHSRQKIELLNEGNIKRKIKYLTNYAVKQVPRLRRSKTMQKLKAYARSKRGLRWSFPGLYLDGLKNTFANLTFPI